MTLDQNRHLQRAVELAAEALKTGNAPFGSVLVDQDGRVLLEEHNRIGSGDATRHPEFAIARWAAKNLSEDERALCTVYTSGEHCPMCAAAHAYVGLGPIVYASSSDQLSQWRKEFGIKSGPVATLPINQVTPHVKVSGPAKALADGVKELQQKYAAG